MNSNPLCQQCTKSLQLDKCFSKNLNAIRVIDRGSTPLNMMTNILAFI
ncbi:hypothetical protein PSYPI_00620 [Pseudomonas syringae pv. pisi str. 1704B]|uniref:Uncharacterized protein n=1 Tax=Pseudomonas syringae pv. pisi str. 1704B TaxID=629263 RepID=F3G1Q4_PSESJ|nr:hypothetical protein PSYPI_00620 [Pseudomonas syringae pv. pisi str. 1704B]